MPVCHSFLLFLIYHTCLSCIGGSSLSFWKCLILSSSTSACKEILRHYKSGLLIFRAVADPQNSGNSAQSREIRQKYFQIHVGKTYLMLILAIRPVLFTPNVQIYLETSSLQRVNNVPKLQGVRRLMLQKTGH